MLRHLFQEASEGYLEEKKYFRAFKYSLPAYSGYSKKAALLTLRSGYRWLAA